MKNVKSPLTLTIHVTTEDIHEGVRMNCKKCPVARAGTRAFPGKHVRVAVGDWFIGVGVDVEDKKIEWTEYALPTIVKDFITAYDDGQPVEPFSFELSLEPVDIYTYT